MSRALIVSIFADAKQFTHELDKAAGKTRQWGKAAGVAGLAIAGGLAYGMEKSIKMAGEMQVSTARMDQAFSRAGQSPKLLAGNIEELESKGRNLGFTNIDIRESLGGLVTATKSYTESAKALGVAEDVARFKHISLSDATKVVTSAFAGSSRAARQLGINVATVHTGALKVSQAYAKSKAAIAAEFPVASKMTDAMKEHKTALLNALQAKFATIKADAQLKDKQLNAANVISEVSRRLKGQASAFANSGAGGAAKYRAQMEALQENLGATLLPTVQKIIGVFASFTGWLTKHTTVAKALVGGLALLAGALIAVSVATKIGNAASKLWIATQRIFTFTTGISTAATEGQATAMGILNAVMDANPIILVVAGLALLGAAFYLAWTKSATFRRIVTGVFSAVKGAAMSVLNWVKGHWPMIATFLSGPFFPIVALATNAFGVRSALTGAFRSMWHVAQVLWNGLGEVWGAAWGGAWGVVKGYVNLMIGGINALIGVWDSLHFSFGGFNHFGVHIGGFSMGVPQIPKIPLLAQGALVTKPTFAMIGERGPELVLPLSRPARMAALLRQSFGMALMGGPAGMRMAAAGGGGAAGGFSMVAEVPIQINFADGRIMRETRKVVLRQERRGARDLHLDRGHDA